MMWTWLFRVLSWCITAASFIVAGYSLYKDSSQLNFDLFCVAVVFWVITCCITATLEALAVKRGKLKQELAAGRVR
jgi:hypothetical protein